MTLTQTQIDNLITLLQSEDFKSVQQGVEIVETFMEVGTIGEVEFIRLIEDVTGGIILSDEQYAGCVNKLKDLSQVVIKEAPKKSVETICDVVSRYLDRLVIYEVTFESLSSLFVDQKHRIFLTLWSLGWLVLWRTNTTPVTKLDLRYPELVILPKSIGNLINLVELDLSKNQLTILPESIGNLVNLRYLWLDWNHLTSLPDSIGNLKNLIELDLGNNALFTLPESLGELETLAYLELRHNRLQTVPDWIDNLINIRDVDFSGNPL